MKSKWSKSFFICQLLLLLTIILAGCQEADEGKGNQMSLIRATNPAPVPISDKQKDIIIAQKVKEEVMAFDEIYDVAVIKGKKDVLVAYKVRHLERFGMKDIEKNITKRLEKEFPDENFTVSSDYKIFLEAVQLQEDMQKPDFSDIKAEKRLKSIISLQKEMT
ncbi:sporulation protein [Bacillus canaveralius]|uniref:Sporulation protein n=1 Tax=Bacillus canaveralius TaxID=1403243 RepID=A0A2N5GKK8_9BACI|nr:YhcN/YlaJ family sporulation lipoprotein [Bacillus canaveralius]PLR82054.1 sporulation protein [Bacillus canaveralius]PLR98040.1 sporulation protein [Bacillus canaveralius]